MYNRELTRRLEWMPAEADTGRKDVVDERW